MSCAAHRSRSWLLLLWGVVLWSNTENVKFGLSMQWGVDLAIVGDRECESWHWCPWNLLPLSMTFGSGVWSVWLLLGKWVGI